MMWRALVLFVHVATLAQVTAEYAKVNFIENVIEEVASTGSRIVSGWEAYPGQHPHQAMLRMVSPAGIVLTCGGSFVHWEWVITAAHCTTGYITIVVRAGATNITTPSYIAESTVWYNHPTYNDDLFTEIQPNDISILKLPRPLVYNNLVQPIKLQPSSDAYRDYSGQVVYSSGYGRTWTAVGGPLSEVLNWVYLRGVSNNACFCTFGSIVTSTTICAQFYNVTSQSICHGDSGGPLVHVNAEGVPVLIGVTSFVAGGDLGCHSGLPAGFIRPGPFHGWFRNVTGIDFEDLYQTSTLAPTTEGINETTIAPTTEGIVETTIAYTTEGIVETTIAPTTEGSVETTISHTTEGIVETTIAHTTERIVETTIAPTTEGSIETTISHTTEGIVETTISHTTEGIVETTIAPTTEGIVQTTLAPITTPKPESEKDNDDSQETEGREEDSSSSEENPELSQLLKKLEVNVKVNVQLNKYLKKHRKVKKKSF